MKKFGDFISWIIGCGAIAIIVCFVPSILWGRVSGWPLEKTLAHILVMGNVIGFVPAFISLKVKISELK